MTTETMNWIDRFQGLSQLEKPIRDLLVGRSTIVSVPKDTVIFGPGKAPDNLLLLLSGVVRVQQLSEGGREIILYRVHAGESCVLTTACLLAYEDYSAEGIAETEVEAVAIPRSVFDDLIAQSETFRRFVFSAYSRRITDLFMVIEELAFQRIDIRLAHKLVELAGAGDAISATHQQMAAELGTAREVISRQLREFQRREWITQSRGSIQITDRAALEKLAATEV
ncbi:MULTISPECIES: Crp/Fnr family transcriptional regulator [Pseudovibrio]|uniref:Crp/Fnr family transcriptional regulator n=1 Tax=Stappiaceae TaxID=2821832 RepID=UPI002364FF40|nr:MULTISPECIES: Crp/Fnr family transcriptional regulator [Pseudovibrio]MDD7910933.1 Crp/Fnr family transcriptional regulator [Pseudovibrio exalbescens]MDX5593347.1 Crp/Fnr family transcriptional regulator [Pseudovibrio sp. SPO723]